MAFLKNNLFTNIPFSLRGRDFDQNIMPFTFPYFELQENIPIELLCGCNNFIFSKCQNLVIHKPISYLLLSKNNSLHMRLYTVHIGKTSANIVCELMQNNIILISLTIVWVHVDIKTRIPKNNCKSLMHFKKNVLQQANDNKIFKDLAATRKKDLKQSSNILSNYMTQLNNRNATAIFSHEFTLEITDLDVYRHVNQGYYSRVVENCLYKYHDGFYNAQWRIKQFCQTFVQEMTVKIDKNNRKSSKCNVNILLHNTINNGKQQEIIGYIGQNGNHCCQFRVILVSKKMISNKL